jgi:hypothetical protein
MAEEMTPTVPPPESGGPYGVRCRGAGVVDPVTVLLVKERQITTHPLMPKFGATADPSGRPVARR